MTKKEKRKKQLEQQLKITKDRGPTFVGIRPVVFGSRKYSIKEIRRANKKLCREY